MPKKPIKNKSIKLSLNDSRMDRIKNLSNSLGVNYSIIFKRLIDSGLVLLENSNSVVISLKDKLYNILGDVAKTSDKVLSDVLDDYVNNSLENFKFRIPLDVSLDNLDKILDKKFDLILEESNYGHFLSIIIIVPDDVKGDNIKLKNWLDIRKNALLMSLKQRINSKNETSAVKPDSNGGVDTN